MKFEENQPVHVSYDTRYVEQTLDGHLVVFEGDNPPATRMAMKVPANAKITPLYAPAPPRRTDPTASIREHLPATEWRAFATAVERVLDLQPPALQDGDDPAMHELLTEGWRTAHYTVLTVIADAIAPEPQGTASE